MSGEWHFSFKYENKKSFDVPKYQQLLAKLRKEYEPQFSILDSTEAVIEWAEMTAEKMFDNNVFAEFSYRCTKEHIKKGPGHGVWTLFWDPTLSRNNNDLHARCAPLCFKELSNEIQVKLATEFPNHFVVSWKNGLSGYAGCSTSAINRRFDTDVNCVMSQMMIAMECNDSNSRESESETPNTSGTLLRFQ